MILNKSFFLIILILSTTYFSFCQSFGADTKSIDAEVSKTLDLYDILTAIEKQNSTIENLLLKGKIEQCSAKVQNFYPLLSQFKDNLINILLREEKGILDNIYLISRLVEILGKDIKSKRTRSALSITQKIQTKVSEIRKMLKVDYTPQKKDVADQFTQASKSSISSKKERQKQFEKDESFNRYKSHLKEDPFLILEIEIKDLENCFQKLQIKDFDSIIYIAEKVKADTESFLDYLETANEFERSALSSLANRLYVIAEIIKDYAREENPEKIKFFLEKFKKLNMELMLLSSEVIKKQDLKKVKPPEKDKSKTID